MANAFERGQATGIAAMRTGADIALGANSLSERVRSTKKREELDREQFEADEEQRQVNNRLALDRQGMIRQDFEVRQKIAQRDAENYLVSKNAFDKFNEERSQLDPGAQDYPERYAELVGRTMPLIARNDSMLKAFEATRGADERAMGLTYHAVAKAQRMQLLADIAKYGLGEAAQAIGIDVQSGVKTKTEGMAALYEMVNARKRELKDQELQDAIKLQSAIAEARWGPTQKTAQEKVDQSVEVETKEGGTLIKRRMTPAELKADMEAKQADKVRPRVTELVKQYAIDKPMVESGDRRSGLFNINSRDARMAAAAAELKMLGYDTEGNPLGQSTGARKIGKYQVEEE